MNFKKLWKKKAVVVDTNMILKMGRLHAGDILNKFGNKVFIPWSVLEEMILFRKEALYIKRHIQKHGVEPRFIRKLKFQDAKTRHRRCESVLSVWPIFSEKIENFEWKIIGSDSKRYFKIFNGKVQNSDGIIGEDIGTSDVRIIASCLFLQAKGFNVVLLTRDKELMKQAASRKINVTNGISEIKN